MMTYKGFMLCFFVLLSFLFVFSPNFSCTEEDCLDCGGFPDSTAESARVENLDWYHVPPNEQNQTSAKALQRDMKWSNTKKTESINQ
ncbi:hypothetical protein L6Q79_15495 [bacterium]|nr:hypothetical protein [bacterium]NUN45408.1 hypothetical protein [bacterium]